MFFYLVAKNHKLWKTIENTVIYIWNCYLAVPNKCENSKPSLRKSAWEMHRKRDRKSSENHWKTMSTNMIQTWFKTCKFRFLFSSKSTTNLWKSVKNGVDFQVYVRTSFVHGFWWISGGFSWKKGVEICMLLTKSESC